MASVDTTNIQPYTSRAGAVWRTDDATQVSGLLLPTRADHSYHVMLRVVATETDDFDETSAYTSFAAFKNDGGTLAIVGAVAATFTAETTAAWAVTMDASGSNIRVRITGAADTDITWLIAADVLEVGASATGTGWTNG